MTLNAWQERLYLYFAGLRQQVIDSGAIRPIFALEHDLNEDEWKDLVYGLKSHIDSSGPAKRHWLAWSVYAAEIGYSFKGDQYWQTFAVDLPKWDGNGDRDFVKDIFLQFRKEFGGVQPSGAWANNFTIICWPIANAILPKDLQRHLASILYDVRDAFTASLIRDPAQLGSLIESRSEGTSKRFKQFAGQHALVGRIAAALLLSGLDSGSQLLVPHTLARITRDLQTEQNSRDWLSVAKQRASSVTFYGTRSQSSPRTPVGPNPNQEFCQVSPNDPQVEILLRPTAENSWSLRALMPNLASITLGHPSYQRIVSSQRSFLSGAARSHFPPRFFLYAKREVEMKSLPKLGEPFMRFEDTAEGFDAFIQRCCSFPNFTSLFFKVRAGEETTRLRSYVLRQDSQYLYVNTKPFHSSTILHLSRPVSVGCEGLHALLIDVPSHPSSFYIEGAKRLGLDIQKGVRVRPVAYPALSWSGNGDVTWSEISPKLLSIESDVESEGFFLSLLGPGCDQRLDCPAANSGANFIDLSDLGVGDYQLNVIASIPSARDQLATGNVSIRVIPKDEMVLDKELARGFTVLLSPLLPSLEELWNGSATLEAYGPVGKAIVPRMTFYSDTEAKHSISTFSGKELTLPITSNEWQAYLDGAKRNRQVLSAYEMSASCTISFRSIELGQNLLHFEREFVPFRWLLREKNSSYRLRLIQNDTFAQVDVLYFDFARPSSPQVQALSADGEMSVPKNGGMFVAARDETRIAIVAPPAPMNSLSALGAVVHRLSAPTTIEGVVRLFDSIKLWTEAQLTGDFLARNRRDAAIKILRVALVEGLCGSKWVASEADLENSRIRLDGLYYRLGSGGDYRLARAAMNATSDLAEATPADIAGIALELCTDPNRTMGITPASHSNQTNRITCLLEILRLDDRSVEPLPALDRECVALVTQMPSLCRILRFLLLAKQRPRESSGAKILGIHV
jgi:hypothetical protein